MNQLLFWPHFSCQNLVEIFLAAVFPLLLFTLEYLGWCLWRLRLATHGISPPCVNGTGTSACIHRFGLWRRCLISLRTVVTETASKTKRKTHGSVVPLFRILHWCGMCLPRNVRVEEYGVWGSSEQCCTVGAVLCATLNSPLRGKGPAVTFRKFLRAFLLYHEI